MCWKAMLSSLPSLLFCSSRLLFPPFFPLLILTSSSLLFHSLPSLSLIILHSIHNYSSSSSQTLIRFIHDHRSFFPHLYLFMLTPCFCHPTSRLSLFFLLLSPSLLPLLSIYNNNDYLHDARGSTDKKQLFPLCLHGTTRPLQFIIVLEPCFSTTNCPR